MGAHPAASTIQAINEGNKDRALEYNGLAFKRAGRCVMRPRPFRVGDQGHDYTRGGVRLRGNLRWWHCCRACWEVVSGSERR